MGYQTTNKLTIHVRYPQLKDALLEMLDQNVILYELEGRTLRFSADSAITYKFIDILSDTTYRGSVEYEYEMDDETTITRAFLVFQDGELIDEQYKFED